MNDKHVTIRAATPSDARALRWLAAIDSAPRLRGRALLAELGGAPVAALSVETGAVIANPFEHTADVVRMLRLGRYQLIGQAGRRPLRSLHLQARVTG